MSQRERDRLVAVREVAEGLLTMAAGARKYRVSLRHMRRVVRRYEQAEEGERDGVVMHGLRGRPSNRRLPEALRAEALEKARGELYRDFGPTLLSEHLARDPAIGPVKAATLRLWMMEAGLWVAEARKARHRRGRERRAAYGEMVPGETTLVVRATFAGVESESLPEIAASTLRSAPPGTVAEVILRSEIEGDVTGFGARFWSEVLAVAPDAAERLRSGLAIREVTYQDRYVRTPLGGRLVLEVMRTLPAGGDWHTGVTFRLLTTSHQGRQFVSRHVLDDWSDGSEAARVLEALFSERDLSLEGVAHRMASFRKEGGGNGRRTSPPSSQSRSPTAIGASRW